MAVIIKCDAPLLLREWFDVHQSLLREKKIEAKLRLPSEDEHLNKALATFETPTHVASLTVWGTGMLEFIVLDIAAQKEVIVTDIELSSPDAVAVELNRSLANFLRVGGMS